MSAVSTSDHSLVHGFWKSVLNKTTQMIMRNFYKANYDIISCILSIVNWRSVFVECRTINKYWLSLYEVLMQLIRVCVPLTSSQGRPSKWLPKHLRRQLLNKRKAWRRWRSALTEVNKQDFCRKSHISNHKIRAYRSNEENNLLALHQNRFFTYVQY